MKKIFMAVWLLIVAIVCGYLSDWLPRSIAAGVIGSLIGFAIVALMDYRKAKKASA